MHVACPEAIVIHTISAHQLECIIIILGRKLLASKLPLRRWQHREGKRGGEKGGICLPLPQKKGILSLKEDIHNGSTYISHQSLYRDISYSPIK